MPSAKCRTGNIRAIQTIQAGALLPSGIKIPDRNSSGRIDALTMAGEASALGMTEAMAKPSAQKLAAPDHQHDEEPEQRDAGRDSGAVEDPAEGGGDHDQQD